MPLRDFFGTKDPERGPRTALPLLGVWRAFERGTARLYAHAWNPLRHSGAIVSTLLGILIVTGIALLFVYRLGSPYASVSEATARSELNWLRTVHRYATDFSMVAIAMHALKMFVEGRTWGPRALAWISGCVLGGMFLFSSYTGFILVWDRFGLKVARLGAEIFDLLPFLPASIQRTFSGDVPLGTSFFFMNLFLHVAVPLGMGAALGVHLARVKKPAWLLPARGAGILGLGLLAWALLHPMKMDQPADPLALGTEAVQSLAFSIWPWIQETFGALAAATIFLALTFAALTAPKWWRPREGATPIKSVVDEDRCEGCRQCFEDCPFHAIEMRPRAEAGPGKSEMVAHVLNDLCVGCGICSGSCNQFSVGPPPWNGRMQLNAIGAGVPGEKRSAFFACAHRSPEMTLPPSVIWHRVECVGILHSATFTRMFQSYARIVVWSCERGECGSRLGGARLKGRLLERRHPALPPRTDLSRLLWLESGLDFAASADAIRRYLEEGVIPRSQDLIRRPSRKAKFAAAAITATALWAMSSASSVTWGRGAQASGLRVTWRQPAEREANCRTLSPEELAARPAHMRVATECQEPLKGYVLKILLDGEERISKSLRPKGARADRPVNIHEDLNVAPGRHEVEVVLEDEGKPGASGIHGKFQLEFTAGRSRLITLDRQGRLTADGSSSESQGR